LILKGKLYFDEEEFIPVSAEAKDFIQALLKTNPDERLSATEALAHPWLQARSEKTRSLYAGVERYSNSRKKLAAAVMAVTAMNRLRDLKRDAPGKSREEGSEEGKGVDT
jgi:serine/threonine protein kinase